MRALTALRTSLVALVAIQAALRAEEILSTNAISNRVGSATVTLRCERDEGLGSGSGFVVERSGVVVTNFHVVKGCRRTQIKLTNGDVLEVVGVYGLDTDKDLAIVKVLGFNLPIVELGDSETVRQGDRLVVVGNPLGILEGSVSEGILSGVRELEGYRVFQMDAAISPGSSGGPVVNEFGQVVGVTTFKLTSGEGLNFAVPINYVRGMLTMDRGIGIDALVAAEESRSLFSRPLEPGPKPAAEPAPDSQQLYRYWIETGLGKRVQLTQSANSIHLEWAELPSPERRAPYKIAELKWVGGQWIGKAQYGFQCRVAGATPDGGYRPSKPLVRWEQCDFESEIQIMSISERRIEGWYGGYPATADINCVSCKVEGKPVKMEFTLVTDK